MLRWNIQRGIIVIPKSHRGESGCLGFRTDVRENGTDKADRYWQNGGFDHYDVANVRLYNKLGRE